MMIMDYNDLNIPVREYRTGILFLKIYYINGGETIGTERTRK